MNRSLRSTNHDLSRRAVLRGVGVCMALPWLESIPAWGAEKSGSSGILVDGGIVVDGEMLKNLGHEQAHRTLHAIVVS